MSFRRPELCRYILIRRLDPRSTAIAEPLHVAEPGHFLLFRLVGRCIGMSLIFGRESCNAEWFDDSCLTGCVLRHHHAIPMG